MEWTTRAKAWKNQEALRVPGGCASNSLHQEAVARDEPGGVLRRPERPHKPKKE